MGREVRRVPPEWEHPLDDNGQYRPLSAGEMPDPRASTSTHYQMYETTSEGTPISPVLTKPETLARWLLDNKASAFARQTASYDAWLKVCKGEASISGVISQGRVINGVENGQSDQPTQKHQRVSPYLRDSEQTPGGQRR